MDVQSLRGVYPAIVTLFTSDDRLDEAALGKVTDYVIDGGMHAIMAAGSRSPKATFNKQPWASGLRAYRGLPWAARCVRRCHL